MTRDGSNERARCAKCGQPWRVNHACTPPRTGWTPGMLQDDSRELSRWLSSRIDSRMHARDRAEGIRDSRT